MKQEEGQGAGSAKEKIKLKLVMADTLPPKSHLGEGPIRKNYKILDICPKWVYPTYLEP